MFIQIAHARAGGHFREGERLFFHHDHCDRFSNLVRVLLENRPSRCRRGSLSGGEAPGVSFGHKKVPHAIDKKAKLPKGGCGVPQLCMRVGLGTSSAVPGTPLLFLTYLDQPNLDSEQSAHLEPFRVKQYPRPTTAHTSSMSKRWCLGVTDAATTHKPTVAGRP